MKKTDKKFVIFEQGDYVFGEYYEDGVSKSSQAEPMKIEKHAFTEAAGNVYNRLLIEAYDAENKEQVNHVEVGDTIELTYPFYTSECEYDKGARFKVVYVHSNGDACIFDNSLIAIPYDYFEVVNEKAKTDTEVKPKQIKDTTFKVGDKVRFRSWDDMAQEYGERVSGTIDCYYGFLSAMKPLCGTTATIKKLYYDGEVLLTDFSVSNDLINVDKWSYSIDMLEKVDSEEAETAPKAEPKPARDTNFKVGDKVRFRSWDDMEKEYGVGIDGTINCQFGFTDGMRPLCGKTTTIKEIGRPFNGSAWVDLTNDYTFKEFEDYDYSLDMIEKI